MAKYRITSIPQSLPKAQKGLFKNKLDIKTPKNKFKNLFDKGVIDHKGHINLFGKNKKGNSNQQTAPQETWSGVTPDLIQPGQDPFELKPTYVPFSEFTQSEANVNNTLNKILEERERLAEEKANRDWEEMMQKREAAFKTSKKYDKIEPLYTIDSEGYTDEDLAGFQESGFFPVKDPKTNKINLYPINEINSRIINNGLRTNEIVNKLGIGDAKLIKSAFGDLMKAADEQYASTVQNKLLQKSLDEGISLEEAAKKLSGKLGIEKGLQNYIKPTKKLINTLIDNIKSDINKPAEKELKSMYFDNRDPNATYSPKIDYNSTDPGLKYNMDYYNTTGDWGKFLKDYSDYNKEYNKEYTDSFYNKQNQTADRLNLPVSDRTGDLRNQLDVTNKNISLTKQIGDASTKAGNKTINKKYMEQLQADMARTSDPLVKYELSKKLDAVKNNPEAFSKLLKKFDTGEVFTKEDEDNINALTFKILQKESQDAIKDLRIKPELTTKDKVLDVLTNPFDAFKYSNQGGLNNMWSSGMGYNERKLLERANPGLDLGTQDNLVGNTLNTWNPLRFARDIDSDLDRGDYESAGLEALQFASPFIFNKAAQAGRFAKDFSKAFPGTSKAQGFWGSIGESLNPYFAYEAIRPGGDFNRSYDAFKSGNIRGGLEEGVYGALGLLGVNGARGVKGFNTPLTKPFIPNRLSFKKGGALPKYQGPIRSIVKGTNNIAKTALNLKDAQKSVSKLLKTPTQGQQLSIVFPEEYKTKTGEPTNIDAYVYETVSPPTGLNLNVTANPNSPFYKAINPKTGEINFEQALSIIRKTAGGDEVIESLFNNPELWQGLDTNLLHMDAKQLLKDVQQSIPALNKREVPFDFEEGSLDRNRIYDPEIGDYRSVPNSAYGLDNIYPKPFNRLYRNYKQGSNRSNPDVLREIFKYPLELELRKSNLINNEGKEIEEVKSALENGKTTITTDSGITSHINEDDLKKLEQKFENKINIINKQQEAYLANKDSFADFQLTNPRTIQFSNVDQFGYGSSDHGNTNDTLAHVHVYENMYKPDSLYISQIQSDAAKHFSKMKRRYIKDGSEEFDLEGYLPDFEKLSTGNYFSPDNSIDYAEPISGETADVIKRNLQQKRVLMTNKKSTEKRLIQEMLQYAADQGKKYIYIPTPELSTKIQGNDYASSTYEQYKKHYIKLFGKSGVLPETDQFGNEWLRLEVPESYIKGEGIIEAYKKGGSLPTYQGPIRSVVKSIGNIGKTALNLRDTEQLVSKALSESVYKNLLTELQPEKMKLISNLKNEGILSKTLDEGALVNYPNLLDLATKKGIQAKNTVFRSTRPFIGNSNILRSSENTQTELPLEYFNYLKSLPSDVARAAYMSSHISPINVGARTGLDHVIGLNSPMDALYYSRQNVNNPNIEYTYGPLQTELRFPFDFSEGDASTWLQQYRDMPFRYKLKDGKTMVNREYAPGVIHNMDIVADSAPGSEGAILGLRNQRVLEPVRVRYNETYKNLEDEESLHNFMYDIMSKRSPEEQSDYITHFNNEILPKLDVPKDYFKDRGFTNFGPAESLYDAQNYLWHYNKYLRDVAKKPSNVQVIPYSPFSFGFEKGGAIELELTPKQIKEYIKKGYIIEDI